VPRQRRTTAVTPDDVTTNRVTTNRDHRGGPVEVKIGVQHAARELALESSATSEEISATVAKALESGQGLLSLDDEKGRRILVPIAKLAYVEIGEPEARKVGFGTL
jgi:hypothetical protein